MTNFRKTVVTFVLRLSLFLKDSIATLARILRSTQPSAPRTYSVGSDGSIRTLRPLTDTVQVATNEVPRLTLPAKDYLGDKNGFCKCAFCTTAQSVEYWSFKKKDAITSSLVTAPTIPPEVWEALSQADGYAEREAERKSGTPQWIGRNRR